MRARFERTDDPENIYHVCHVCRAASGYGGRPLKYVAIVTSDIITTLIWVVVVVLAFNKMCVPARCARCLTCLIAHN